MPQLLTLVPKDLDIENFYFVYYSKKNDSYKVLPVGAALMNQYITLQAQNDFDWEDYRPILIHTEERCNSFVINLKQWAQDPDSRVITTHLFHYKSGPEALQNDVYHVLEYCYVPESPEEIKGFFHIESLADRLKQNLESALFDNRANGIRPIYIGTQTACKEFGTIIAPDRF